MELFLFSTGGWTCCSSGHCLCITRSPQSVFSLLQLSHHPPNSPDYRRTSKYFSFPPISVSLASLRACLLQGEEMTRQSTSVTQPRFTFYFTNMHLYNTFNAPPTGDKRDKRGVRPLCFSPDWGKRLKMSVTMGPALRLGATNTPVMMWVTVLVRH